MLWSRFTAARGRLPDILIIGAPKCATTSLYAYLCQHDRFARARRKEIHYFDENFARGPDWYRRQFPAASSPQITGEASTAYLFAPRAAARAAALVPHAKILAVLRDPVRRVISHYWHNVRRRQARGGFEAYFREALSDNQARAMSQARAFYRYPVQWGYYKEQIARWLDHYPRAAFHFIRFEDFVADPNGHMDRVFEFLGLPAFELGNCAALNASPPYTVEESEITRRLADIYREKNAGLEQLIGPQFAW